LAVAIIKIWERCEIVKIAIKRGVENTDGEVMAEEIKVSFSFWYFSNIWNLALKI